MVANKLISVNVTPEMANLGTVFIQEIFKANNWAIAIMVGLFGVIGWLAVTQIPSLVETFPKLNENLLKVAKSLVILKERLKALKEIKSLAETNSKKLEEMQLDIEVIREEMQNDK